jgi:SNF2 family DNA or RNA helicase
MNSHEIAKLLAELKTNLENETKEKEQLNLICEELIKQVREVEAKLNSVRTLRDEHVNKRNNTSSSIRETQRKIAEQERALRRAQEAELLAAKQADLFKQFEITAFDAPWNAANRSDGQGAKKHQISGAMTLAAAIITAEKPGVGGLLFDKRGLGKTLTSFITADLVQAKKVIYITLPDTMKNHEQEARMWMPHRFVWRLGGRSKLQREVTYSLLKDLPNWFLIVNKEAWRKDESVLEELAALQPDMLIFDEAHYINKTSTKTYQGTEFVRFAANMCPECGEIPTWHCWRCGNWLDGNIRLCDSPENGTDDEGNIKIGEYELDRNVRCRDCGWHGKGYDAQSINAAIEMTGSPILNKPEDLYTLLHLADPEGFDSKSRFLNDFCIKRYDYASGKYKWTWRSANDEEDMLKKISHRVVLRNRYDAEVEIPEQQIIVHDIEFETAKYPAQFKIMQQVKEEALIELENAEVLPIMSQLAVLTRLRQAITYPAGIPGVAVTESIKLDKAEELIKQFVEDGERVILFSQFKAPLRALYNRLSAAGLQPCVYDGDTPTWQRDAIRADFDARTAPRDPRFNIALCNYKACAEGVNFNAATMMVILDDEWNPGKNDQAYGRIDRMGQTKETQVHIIRVEKTIDDWMAEINESKKEVIQSFESEVNVAVALRDAIRSGGIL